MSAARVSNEGINRMDSGINMLWDSSELGKNQLRWLEKQLQEIPQKETVVVISHCYVISSCYYDELAEKSWGDLPDVMSKLCPLFEKYKVDLHINGHHYFFEYLKKDSVNYMVLGAMGGNLRFLHHSPVNSILNLWQTPL